MMSVLPVTLYSVSWSSWSPSSTRNGGRLLNGISRSTHSADARSCALPATRSTGSHALGMSAISLAWTQIWSASSRRTRTKSPSYPVTGTAVPAMSSHLYVPLGTGRPMITRSVSLTLLVSAPRMPHVGTGGAGAMAGTARRTVSLPRATTMVLGALMRPAGTPTDHCVESAVGVALTTPGATGEPNAVRSGSDAPFTIEIIVSESGRHATVALAGARTETRTVSLSRSATRPNGSTLLESTCNTPVSASSGMGGSSRMGCVARAVSDPSVAIRSYDV